MRRPLPLLLLLLPMLLLLASCTPGAAAELLSSDWQLTGELLLLRGRVHAGLPNPVLQHGTEAARHPRSRACPPS